MEDGWEEREHTEGGAQKRRGGEEQDMRDERAGAKRPKGRACDVTASNPQPG